MDKIPANYTATPPPQFQTNGNVTLIHRARRWKAFCKFVNHVAGACMALYEFVTLEEDLPKFRDALRG